jgi:hypothetical protein
VWIELNPIFDLLDWNDIPQTESHPRFTAIGTDGSREIVGFDFRSDPPPVVLVQITSPGWSDAIVQAPTFAEFLELIEHGDFRVE